jgi:hypothetical protein
MIFWSGIQLLLWFLQPHHPFLRMWYRPARQFWIRRCFHLVEFPRFEWQYQQSNIAGAVSEQFDWAAAAAAAAISDELVGKLAERDDGARHRARALGLAGGARTPRLRLHQSVRGIVAVVVVVARPDGDVQRVRHRRQAQRSATRSRTHPMPVLQICPLKTRTSRFFYKYCTSRPLLKQKKLFLFRLVRGLSIFEFAFYLGTI